MSAPIKQTDFAQANRAVRNGEFEAGIRKYVASLNEATGLWAMIAENLIYAQQKWLSLNRLDETFRVALFQGDWDNTKRADDLNSRYLDEQESVDFIEISSANLVNEDKGSGKKRRLHLNICQPNSIALFKFVAEVRYDRIHIFNPDALQVAVALTYKLIWNSDIIVHLSLQDDSYLSTQPAVLYDFDQITVSTEAEQNAYGGKIFDRTTPIERDSINGKNFKPLRTSLYDFAVELGGLTEKLARAHNEFVNFGRDGNANKMPDAVPKLLIQTSKQYAYPPLFNDSLNMLLKVGSPGNYVIELYKALLRRAPQIHELKHYTQQLIDRSETRAGIALLVLASEEHLRVLADFRPVDNIPVPNVLFTVPKPGDIDPKSIVLPRFDKPLVSILIPVYGKLEYTLMCLKSIAVNLPTRSFEIIVLDDRSPDHSATELQKIENLHVVLNPSNLGFLRSCNYGSQFANGQYLLFLNNDTQVEAGWLDHLVQTYDDFKDVGLVGSKLVYPNGSLQEAGGIVWRDGSAWNYGRNSDPELPEFNYVRETDYCSGASIIIEKTFFQGLGLFDERYAPAYYEDTDLAFKVRAAGKKVIYQPRSVVVHFEGVSHGTSTDVGLKAYQTENGKKFFERWKPELEKGHFEPGASLFTARERSSFKTTVLIIDHYVPKPDRDAGSKSMWHIIKTMQHAGLNIKFWPHNNHYDLEYAPLLEAIGVEVIAGDKTVGGFSDWWLLNGKQIGHVLLSRPHVAVDFIDIIRNSSSANVIYYGHDIHHLRLEKQFEVTGDRKLLLEISAVRILEQKIWREIDCIYYPSVEEERHVNKWLRAEGYQDKVVRTIPVYAYEDFPELVQKNIRARQSIIFVAGFNHPPNIDAAIWFVEKVMPLVSKRSPRTKLMLVGSSPTDEIRALASKTVAVTGFVTNDQLDAIYRSARVSVAPLLYGGGMKGKVIESMRYGLPCVTTNTGAQGLENALSCIVVADDPSMFATEVLRLLEDDQFWVEKSVGAQSVAKRLFSRAALWKIISGDYVDAN